MNGPMIKRVIARSVAWTAAAALCSIIALAQDSAPTAGQRTDGQIEMDVVHALDASQALKNDLITAATIQSQVRISPLVTSIAIVSTVPVKRSTNEVASRLNSTWTAISIAEDQKAAP